MKFNKTTYDIFKDYTSISHTTSNEVGEQEVEIVYRNGFWRDLFKKEEIKQTFIGSSTVWWYKGTGERAGTLKELEIVNIVEYLRQKRVYGTS